MESNDAISNDRMLQELAIPPSRLFPHSLLFPIISTTPDWRALKAHLSKEGKISKSDCLQIIQRTTDLLSLEENLLELMDPVTIIGDIHGQFYDLLTLLEISGDLSETKYLLLGDFVDRGSFSIEVLLLLYALKINYPNSIFLLRGNHECRQLTSFFNFRTECLVKYDLEVYDEIMRSFDRLPLGCVVNKNFLAVHGGISPELRKLSDIHKINRVSEPPRRGLICDLLWADPIDTDIGTSPERFTKNNIRGCSFSFGVLAANKFLKENKLISIIRGHEAQLDGFKLHKWNGNSEFPVVITVFSAPNYCDMYKNKGAIIKFANHSMHVQQFNYTVHPYILPNFLDAFS